MDLATLELIKRLHALGPERRAHLDDKQLADIDLILSAEFHDQIDALCRKEEASFQAGPLFWLTSLTKTENPQYEAQTEESGKPVPFLAPFPKKSYFVPLFAEFLAAHPMLMIPKSRTMMTSWSAAAFAAWAAQWKGEETVIQTTNEDKAKHLIDYVRQLVEYQPPWLSERHPTDKRSSFAIAWAGGGEVAAIPSGAGAIRAFHPTRYIQDESAFMAEGEEALNAVLPTHAKIICISTAAPGWFGDMCEL